MNFLFINNVNGAGSGGRSSADHVVHAAGCQDREVLNAPEWTKHPIEADSLAAAGSAFRSEFYADFEPESQQMFAADFKPCCFKAAS